MVRKRKERIDTRSWFSKEKTIMNVPKKILSDANFFTFEDCGSTRGFRVLRSMSEKAIPVIAMNTMKLKRSTMGPTATRIRIDIPRSKRLMGPYIHVRISRF